MPSPPFPPISSASRLHFPIPILNKCAGALGRYELDQQLGALLCGFVISRPFFTPTQRRSITNTLQPSLVITSFEPLLPPSLSCSFLSLTCIDPSDTRPCALIPTYLCTFIHFLLFFPSLSILPILPHYFPSTFIFPPSPIPSHLSCIAASHFQPLFSVGSAPL